MVFVVVVGVCVGGWGCLLLVGVAEKRKSCCDPVMAALVVASVWGIRVVVCVRLSVRFVKVRRRRRRKSKEKPRPHTTTLTVKNRLNVNVSLSSLSG